MVVDELRHMGGEGVFKYTKILMITSETERLISKVFDWPHYIFDPLGYEFDVFAPFAGARSIAFGSISMARAIVLEAHWSCATTSYLHIFWVFLSLYRLKMALVAHDWWWWLRAKVNFTFFWALKTTFIWVIVEDFIKEVHFLSILLNFHHLDNFVLHI